MHHLSDQLRFERLAATQPDEVLDVPGWTRQRARDHTMWTQPQVRGGGEHFDDSLGA
jgi:hypothetical protein